MAFSYPAAALLSLAVLSLAVGGLAVGVAVVRAGMPGGPPPRARAHTLLDVGVVSQHSLVRIGEIVGQQGARPQPSSGDHTHLRRDHRNLRQEVGPHQEADDDGEGAGRVGRASRVAAHERPADELEDRESDAADQRTRNQLPPAQRGKRRAPLAPEPVPAGRPAYRKAAAAASR